MCEFNVLNWSDKVLIISMGSTVITSQNDMIVISTYDVSETTNHGALSYDGEALFHLSLGLYFALRKT